MNTLALKIIFTIGVVMSVVIRVPYQRETQNNIIIDDCKTPEEKIILLLISVGMLLLPFTYVLSPWLNFANYRLPLWANILGSVTLAIALWLFWRSHDDLGKNWSPTLQIREGQTLVTNGVYQVIRHPMYTSAFLLCIAQALLLPNWIAGLAGLISFCIAFIARIGKEEQMLLDPFDDEYQAYRQRTKRLVPYVF